MSYIFAAAYLQPMSQFRRSWALQARVDLELPLFLVIPSANRTIASPWAPGSDGLVHDGRAPKPGTAANATPVGRSFRQPGHPHARGVERAGGPHGRPGLVLERLPARVGNGAPSRSCMIVSAFRGTRVPSIHDSSRDPDEIASALPTASVDHFVYRTTASA